MVPYDVGPLQLRDLGNQFTGSKDPHWLHAALVHKPVHCRISQQLNRQRMDPELLCATNFSASCVYFVPDLIFAKPSCITP